MKCLGILALVLLVEVVRSEPPLSLDLTPPDYSDNTQDTYASYQPTSQNSEIQSAASSDQLVYQDNTLTSNNYRAPVRETSSFRPPLYQKSSTARPTLIYGPPSAPTTSRPIRTYAPPRNQRPVRKPQVPSSPNREYGPPRPTPPLYQRPSSTTTPSTVYVYGLPETTPATPQRPTSPSTERPAGYSYNTPSPDVPRLTYGPPAQAPVAPTQSTKWTNFLDQGNRFQFFRNYDRPTYKFTLFSPRSGLY